jgi:hypothetical protein
MSVSYFHEKQPLGPKHVSALGLPMMPIPIAMRLKLCLLLHFSGLLFVASNNTTRDDFRCET